MKIEKITPQIAALYLGQKCDVTWLYTDTVNDAFQRGDIWHDSPIHSAHIQRLQNGEISITLYLRRLESMTEAEAREVFKIMSGMVWGKVTAASCLENWIHLFDGLQRSNLGGFIGEPAAWLYLLSKGFDLFGLIESGLAKEITQQQTT